LTILKLVQKVNPSQLIDEMKILSASGGDPHTGYCGEGELEATLY